MGFKIGIFIPCRNVERSVRAVLSGFSEAVLEQISEIVAVDNCSTDSTLEVLEEYQREETLAARKLTVIANRTNYGVGGSHKIALRYFIARGFSHMFVIHGDNQGDGNAIAKGFLTELHRNPDLDAIFASRFMQESRLEGYNLRRIWGNHVFNFLTRVLTGLKMSDAGTGIFCLKLSLLDEIPYWELDSAFHFNPELTLILYENKTLKIHEVPLHWRDSESGSNVAPLTYCLRLLRILLRYGAMKYLLARPGALAFKKTRWPEPEVALTPAQSSV